MKLNEPIKFGKSVDSNRPENIKLPDKKTMNLYKKEVDGNSWQQLLPAVLIIAAVVFVISKFGVLDRLNYLNELQSEVNEARAALESYNAATEDYDEVLSSFVRYTGNYMTEEEAGLTDRADIIRLLEKSVNKTGELTGISIVGNSVQIQINASDLDRVRQIRESLEDEDCIADVSVYTASQKDKTDTADVQATIVFDIIKGDYVDGRFIPLETGPDDPPAENLSLEEVTE